MPVVRCPHCGETTFTIAGWADVDRCSGCGKPLVQTEADRRALARASVGARDAARRVGDPEDGATRRGKRRFPA